MLTMSTTSGLSTATVVSSISVPLLGPKTQTPDPRKGLGRGQVGQPVLPAVILQTLDRLTRHNKIVVPVLTADQMREVDRLTIQRGTPSQTLMDRAGARVVEVIER